MNYWEEILKEIEKNNLKVDIEKIKLAFSLLKSAMKDNIENLEKII